MDLILVAVTGVSLTLAAVMGVMLARMMRDQRRRSDARVALLTELSAQPVKADPAGGASIARAGDLFHVEPEPSPWPRRFAVIGPMVLVLAAGVVAMKSAIATPERGSASIPAAADAVHPLELLSLRHAQEAGTLTIMGLVQNPRAAAQLSRVEATVLLFGTDGVMLASGRAPLDFTTLGSGDESPFVIRVPVRGPVARYRVGFRGADGRVLAHVDRRTSDSLAQRQEP